MSVNVALRFAHHAHKYFMCTPPCKKNLMPMLSIRISMCLLIIQQKLGPIKKFFLKTRRGLD